MVRHAYFGLTGAVAGVLLACASAAAAPPMGFSFPRLDAHGDPLPLGAVARLGTVRLRHPAPVLAVAFSPDGKALRSSGQDGTIREWDVATGRQRSVTTGTLYHQAEGRRLLAPDERTLIFVHKGRILFSDAATGKEQPGLDGLGTPVSDLTLTPEGKRLVTAAADVRVWDVATRRELLRFEGHRGRVHAVGISPDGRRAASVGWDSTLLIWDLATGKILGKELLLTVNPGSSPVFSPDGKTLVAPDGGPALVFRDAATGKRLQPPLGAEAYLTALLPSPDGSTLAVASIDGTVAIWDIKKARRLHLLAHDPDRAVLAFSPDGRLLAATGTSPASSLRVWDMKTGQQRSLLTAPEPAQRAWYVTGLTFTADGRRLSCLANGRLCTWDVPSGGLVAASSAQGQFGDALSPDGSLVASTSSGPELFFTPKSSGRLPPKFFAPQPVTDTVSLLDGVTGKERLRLSVSVTTARHNAALMGGGFAFQQGPLARFSPDGRLVLARRLGTVRVWEVASGKFLGEFPPGVTEGRNTTHRLMFAANGFPGGFSDGRPRDARAMMPPAGGRPGGARERDQFAHWQLLVALADTLLDAMFSADGRTLLLTCRDGHVLSYDLGTGKERWRRNDLQAGHLLALSPDGRWLATGQHDGQVLVWNLRTSEALGRPDVALTEADLERLWADLGAEEPARAYRTMGMLSASPRAVAFLKARLRPQATADEERLAGLVRALDDSKYVVREAAVRGLKALGALAYGPLLTELGQNPSLEKRRRIEALLATLPVADRLVPAGEALRSYRAVQVLEWAGSSEARAVLVRLAEGPANAALTLHARRVLARVTPGGG